MDELEQARALFIAGIEELQADHYDKAEELFRGSLAFAPGRPASLDNLSVCLMHLKRLPEAEDACRQSLKVDESSATPWFNLGLIQRQMGKPNAALASLQKSIELDPKFPDSWYFSSLLLSEEKRYPESISCCESVLALVPDHIEAMCVMAGNLSELKFYFCAFAILEKAIMIAPENPAPYSKMGRIYREVKDHDKATAFFQKALDLGDPDRERLEYSIAAMTGKTLPKTAPKDYVSGLFDGYAERFETHLTEKLGYNPDTLHSHLSPLLGESLDIIDLGCGTGLMGALVKNQAKRLVGLDLSEKMLDEAGKKKIYDQLILGDINDVLTNRDDDYDLVLAADVLIYVGELSDTFALVHRRLRSGGFFAFSVEGFEGDGFRLNPSMRYSYSGNYIQQLAQNNGFVARTFAHDFLRYEATAPDGKITGYYVVLQKP